MPDRLTDQVALVTGGSSGIGLAIARAIAAQGATVCLVGRDARTLHNLRDELRMFSPADVYVADLSQDAEIHQLAEDFRRKHTRLDIMIHSAGAIALGTIESMPVSQLDLQYRINLRAPFLLTQVLLPSIKMAQGQIVLINSSVGVRVKEGVGAYAATKHGLKAMADALRMEVNQFGVRVLSVYPGNTASAMQGLVQEYTGKQLDTEYLLQPDDIASTVVHALLLPRTAEVTDIHIRPFRKAPA
jgi:NADP-dependent 3-hydroxy acid dehydrogenase YdfG